MGLNRSRLPSSTLRSCEKWARDILEGVASPPTRTWTLDQVSLKSSDLSASALPPTPKGSRLPSTQLLVLPGGSRLLGKIRDLAPCKEIQPVHPKGNQF